MSCLSKSLILAINWEVVASCLGVGGCWSVDGCLKVCSIGSCAGEGVGEGDAVVVSAIGVGGAGLDRSGIVEALDDSCPALGLAIDNIAGNKGLGTPLKPLFMFPKIFLVK
ncbi:hypothetical protein Tco_0376812, partial [Tanacetum coccineum]